MKSKVILGALKILDNMEQIVNNEMLIRGAYVDSDYFNPAMSGSICEGKKYCAIGSLWVSAGIKPEGNRRDGFILPSADQGCRNEVLENNPMLNLAYTSLNETAANYIGANCSDDWHLDSTFKAPIEMLFEGYTIVDIEEDNPSDIVGRPELLEIIATTRRNLLNLK